MAGLEDSSVDFQDNDSDNNSGSDNAQDNSDSGSNSSQNSGSNSGSSDDNASSSNDSDDDEDQEKSEAEKSDVEDNEEEKSEEERSEEERSDDDDDQSEGEQSEQERSESDQSEGEKDAASDASSKDDENCRMTQVNFDESDTQDSRASRTAPRQLKQHWESQPELYGIRRSGRQRKEPTRLQAGQTSGSDEDQPKRRRRRQRTESDDWNVGRSQSDDESEDDYKPSKRVVRAATQARSSRSSQKKSRAAAAKSKSSQRRHKNSSSESDNDYSSDDDVRARHSSRRKTTAKVSYKEVSENDMTDSDDLIEQNYDYEVKDEEELNRETIEKILDHRYGKKGDVGNGTALYNRIKDAVPEEKRPSPKPAEVKAEGETEDGDGELEVQYFIKWKNWAHIHNTWETENSLKAQKVQGMKKLEKYKQTEAEFQSRMKYSNKDEIEWELVNREMERALFQEYFTAERVIAKMAPRTEGAEPDLLVKWCGLPYSEATWEDMNLIKARFPSQVDAFNARQATSTIPSKSGKAAKSRPKFVPLKTQPEYLGADTQLELRNYQLDGLNWLLGSWTKRNSVILADEMGLGKTIQIISFLSVLMNTHQVYGPFLVVVPLSTIAAWQREFQRWAPMMNVIIYIGDIKSRSVMRDCEWYKMGTKSLKFNVVVTTYEILLKDKSFVGSVDWQVLAVDEAHRLKNDDSLLYKCLKDFKTSHRILITGTPLQNSLKELWSLLHFIMPERFDRWEDFQERYENVDEQGNKVVRYKDIHKELEQYLIRRVKKDVEKSLPAKVEQILRVEMSSMQRHIYKLIVTKNFKALSKGTKGPISSFLNIMMELKKCCNHTLLIKEPDNPSDDRLQTLIRGSGKLILLDKLLCRLRDNHRVLIFSQMVRMLDILADYLTLRGFPFQRLDGSVKSEMRKQALDHFNAEGSQDFCFLLSTRAGGLGINLATADTVIIFDSDWNPQNDLQAQARAHRIGQQKQVSVYRLVTKNSVEEDIVERAKKKMVLDHLVIQRMDTTGRTTLNKTGPSSSNPFNKEELASILKFGAEQLFKEEDEEDPQVDIDEVLKMAETHNTDATTAGSEFLSNFKVVSFDNMEEDDLMDTNTNQDDNDNEPSWDDIIPANFRAKVEAEQTEEELKKMYLGPRKRKTVMNGGYDSNSEKHRRKGDQDGDDEDDDEEGSNEDGDDRPKKRGRPRTRDKIKGFTDAEIRRFIKSFKKFAAPLTRLDAIACDAELQEKSEADLKRLGEMLFNECTKAMEEYKTKLKEDPSFEEKKTHRGPTLKLSNVMINAQAVTKANNDLEPLAKEIPADEVARNKYHLQCRVKAVHWDNPWDVDDDSNLLKGVYMYGMGSWENIKMDPSLKLSDKILPDEVNAKPQAKHLQTRVDYLLKVLAKHHEMGAPVTIGSGTGKGTGRGKRRKPKSKPEIIEDDFSSDDNVTRDATMDSMDVTSSVPPREVPPSNGSLSLTEGESLHGPPESKPKEKGKKKKKKKKKATGEEHKGEEKEETEDGEKHKHKEQKENAAEKKPKKKKDKKMDGPMHFTASAEPHTVTPDDLPPQVYEWCKAAMKPMKKQLKKILEISEKEKKESGDNEIYKNLLVKIGRHISEILADITDVTDIQQKRGHLWSFCTIFHPGMKARKLHTLYKKYLERQQDESRSALASEASQSSVASFSQSRPDFSKKRPHPPDRPGDDKERSSKKLKSNHDRSQDGFPKHKHGSSGGNRPKGPHDGGQKPSGVSKRPWGQLHRPDPPTSSPSSTVGWTQASPLARTEDMNMSRYSSAGAYSGWHDPHRNQSHGLEHKSDTYHRYNNDRQGGMSGHHYGRDHNRGMGGFHGDSRSGGDHHRSGDHRGDHNRYGHYSRPSEHGSYHSRPSDDRGSGGYHSHMHRDRKRWSDDHGDSSDRRPFKDPRSDHRSDSRSDPRTESRSEHRTDPRMEHRSPLPTEHRSPFLADPRTPVLPPVAGATGHH